MTDKPVLQPAKDGIYPRCVWCGREIYGPGVIDYSTGENACPWCGKYLPVDYIKLGDTSDAN